MKVILAAVVVSLLILGGFQLYGSAREKTALQKKVDGLNMQIDKLNSENRQISANIAYFLNLDNLLKEFKALFNYKKPGEKLMIIVPEKP